MRMNNICRRTSAKKRTVRWQDPVRYRWRDCRKMAVVKIQIFTEEGRGLLGKRPQWRRAVIQIPPSGFTNVLPVGLTSDAYMRQ